MMDTTVLSALVFSVIGSVLLTFVTSWKNERNSGFAVKNLLFLFSYILLGILFYFLIRIYPFASEYLLLLFDSLIVLLSVLSIKTCYFISFEGSFFNGTIIYLGLIFTRLPSTMVSLAISLGEQSIPDYIYWILDFFILLLVSSMVYFVFTKQYGGNQEEYTTKNNTIFFFLTLSVTSLLKIMQFILSYTGESFLLLLNMVLFFYIFIMFFLFYFLLKEGLKDHELSLMKYLWNEDKKHYEIQKENMDIINIKCHDLRHQIQDYRQQGNVTDKMMNQLEDSIHIYDSLIKTGNEALDVILSSFYLRCNNKKVELTTMADGNPLSFMEETDLYSLFTNMLDNALEYEDSIPEELRFISMTIKKENNNIHIHTENSYVGKETGRKKDFHTTKKDTANHGFGTKSMKNIVSKYQGMIDFLIADDMFQVDVILPLKEQDKP